MSQTSREIVISALEFSCPERLPRDLWILPWFSDNYPHYTKLLKQKFSTDFDFSINVYNPSDKIRNNPYSKGVFIDEWGCEFINVHLGIIGEVRNPIVKKIEDYKNVDPPYGILPQNINNARDNVNRFCGHNEKFILGTCVPDTVQQTAPLKSYFNFARPWERYQFLRGTENAMMDLCDFNKECQALLDRIHEYYLREMEFWVSTDINGIWFMDDWGAQDRLLIKPAIWRDLFKPLYKDYCDMAHANNKYVFMHSDGNILDIYEDLIDIGVDAINSQLFCMDMKEISERFKGRITFWGEIDRQHVLTDDNNEFVKESVQKLIKYFYEPTGGLIAQYEVGPGAKPEAIETVCSELLRY